MVDGADERKMPPEVAEEEITVSWLPEQNGSQETGTSAMPAEAPVEVEQGAAGDIPDEVVRQITQPIIPALGLPANEGVGGQSLSDAETERLRVQAEEEEARLVSQVLVERALAPSEPHEELLDVVTHEAVIRLLGERVTHALPPHLLTIWQHEVLAAHWRAFGSLEAWSPAISRAWEHTEQQLNELFQCLERWLPTHPYVDEVIDLASDVHGPPRWFRRFLLKSERSFHKWLQSVSEGDEVLVDLLALTRYATTELEHAAAWYVLQRNVVETEVQPDQTQLIEALGGLRAITELIREAFGGRNREVRILSLASGAAGGGRLELEMTRRLGKDWRLTIQATDPDALTVARPLAGACVAFRQAQARGEIAQESTFQTAEARPYDLTTWEPGAFDLVLMVGGLHHLRLIDQARCLVEAQRVGKLVMLLEPLYGEAEHMEEFCRQLVSDGEREPARLLQLSSWARRALGKGSDSALLHPTGARDAVQSCERALTVDEMRRLVAASGSTYTVRPLDGGKTPGRPQWLAVIGSAG
jgi:hypothetical protein